MRAWALGVLGLVTVLAGLVPVVGIEAEAGVSSHKVVTTCPWDKRAVQASHTPNQLAEMVTAGMPTQDLIDLIGILKGKSGSQNVYPGNRTYCIPSIVLHDGPNGITLRGAVALPDEITLGATFDPTLAADYGEVLGGEAKADRIAAVQAPDVNLAVNPTWGREGETYGEDPFLSGVLAGAEIQGIQRNGTMAIIKHVGVYTQELDRTGVNSLVSKRAAEEVYLEPATMATEKAHPAGAMCAVGKLNGVEQCASPLVYQTLDKAGFTGFVRSDNHAASNEAEALAAGISLIKPHDPALIEEALAKHQITRGTLVGAVDKVLAVLFAYHKFPTDRGHRRTTVTVRDSQGSEQQEKTAEAVDNAGTVLLKNDGVLPLAKGTSVAVIGPGAGQDPVDGEQGSGHVPDPNPITDVQGILEALGTKDVTYTDGEVEKSRTLLSRSYTKDEHEQDGVDSATTTYTTKRATQVELTLTRTIGNSTARLYVDGKPTLYLNFIHGGGVNTDSTSVTLEAGQHHITISWPASQAVPEVRLANVTGVVAQAVAAAKASSVAVVVVTDPTGENDDRANLSLPGYQNALVSAVAQVNPRTVVVIDSGGAVLTPWRNEVAAVLDQLFPGAEGGLSLGLILSGQVNPSGKLPFTFPQSEALSPLRGADTSGTSVVPGGGAGEGLDVGYRWYRAANIPAAYPFGYGLSYTTFSVRGLSITPTGTGWRATALVTNTGTKRGRDVLEGYVSWPSNADEPINLRGFSSVVLSPGQTKRVAVAVRASSLESYLGNRWTLVAGQYHFYLGADALDLGLGVPFSVSLAG
jgi:beta-glucosidase